MRREKQKKKCVAPLVAAVPSSIVCVSVFFVSVSQFLGLSGGGRLLGIAASATNFSAVTITRVWIPLKRRCQYLLLFFGASRLVSDLFLLTFFKVFLIFG